MLPTRTLTTLGMMAGAALAQYAPAPPAKIALRPVAAYLEQQPPAPAAPPARPAPAPAPPRPAPPDFDIPSPALAPAAIDLDEIRFAFEDMKIDLQDFDMFHAREMARMAVEKAEDMSHLALAKGLAFAPQRAKAMTDDRVYEAGQRALENHRYDEALECFNQVSARGGSRADSAWYWKAYTLNKLGKRDEAQAAIAELRKSYPNSRWLDDAKALELEVKQASGQPVRPENESDEDLKLIAINGIAQTDPDRAVPLLESLLKGTQPPKIKRNALYVLAQMNSPRAQQLLEQVARGQANPDLQILAIRYYAETQRRRSGGAQVLGELYNSSTDVAVKRAILGALESSRDKDRLLQIAKTEKANDLRLEAIRRLAGMNGAQAEVWQLYQSEGSPEIRQQILESLPQNGNLDRFVEVARTDKDPKLRRAAIRSLSSPRAVSSADALVSIYGSDQDATVKRAVIDALYAQHNAKSLIQVARAEKDPDMQRRIVERIANMKTPEATEYLMEILK